MPYHTVGAFVHRDQMAGAVQFFGAGHTRWAGAHHAHGLARSLRRRLRDYPAFVKAAVDDGALVDLDGHRRRADAEHARPLARGWTHAASELGKIVGPV